MTVNETEKLILKFTGNGTGSQNSLHYRNWDHGGTATTTSMQIKEQSPQGTPKCASSDCSLSGHQTTQWGFNSFLNKWYWASQNHVQKNAAEPSMSVYAQKQIHDLNPKHEIVKCLEQKVGEIFMITYSAMESQILQQKHKGNNNKN